MLRAITSRYRELSPPVRTLLRLHWTYSFTTGLVGIFIQLYLFVQFKSVSFNVLATLITYTGIAIGFCAIGFLASLRGWNLKYAFLASFLVVAASFSILILPAKIPLALLFMLINGIGQGLYWLSLHTYELSETQNHERDFYASVLSAGNQILSIAAPAAATSLIFAAHALSLGQFSLLFAAAPLILVLGSFGISALRDYRPHRVLYADVAYFFTEDRNRTVQTYIAGNSMQDVLNVAILPVVAITVLDNSARVGAYNTALAVLAALSVLAVGYRRTEGNRFTILATALGSLVPMALWLASSLTMRPYLLFSIGKTMLDPLASVSNHVISLETMESIGRPGSDFYATMLLRDFSLWLWRMLCGMLFLVAAGVYDLTSSSLSIGMILIAASYLVTMYGASSLLSAQPAEQNAAVQSRS